MRTLFLTLSLTLVLMLTGCSGGVTRPEGRPATNDALLTEPADIAVSLSENIRKQVEAEEIKLRLDPNHLQEAIASAFAAQGLLAKNDVMPSYHINVEITEMRIRSTSAAVWLGMMAGKDRMKGRVTLSGSDNQPLHYFDVSVSYSPGGIAGGLEGRLRWLYERFAKEMVKELTSKPKSAAK